MKITFVLQHAHMSGGIRVVALYAERLAARGHSVSVISVPLPVMSLRAKVSSWVRGRGWPVRGPDRSFIDGTGVPHHTLETFRPVTDADVPDADAVVATWWETAEWVSALSPAKGRKFYFVQHRESIWAHDPPRADATYRLPLTKITISAWLEELLRQDFAQDDVIRVPNSVETRQFTAPEREKGRVPTVGVLYAAIPHKGVAVAFQALEQARAKLGRIKLVTFGLEAPGSALPLPDDAEFVLDPSQDLLPNLYAQCDVWLCASRGEGFHLPPLEAMACRCPVVSTRVGGPVDTIRHGENGYLYDIDDVKGLSAGLIEVLGMTPTAWKTLSDAAYDTAIKYTWDDATDLFEAALLREPRQQGGDAGSFAPTGTSAGAR